MTHHNGCLRVLRSLRTNAPLTIPSLAYSVALTESGAAARFRQLRRAPYNCTMECKKIGPRWYYSVKHIPAKTRKMLGEG